MAGGAIILPSVATLEIYSVVFLTCLIVSRFQRGDGGVAGYFMDSLMDFGSARVRDAGTLISSRSARRRGRSGGSVGKNAEYDAD